MASSSKSDENIVQTNCQYPNRKCHHAVIPSYNFCLRHILEDKNAPYRPCSFTYPNSNKKCPLAAPKGDKRDTGYCQLHLWKLLLKRQKSSAKNVPPMTTESLLTELAHYVRPVRNSYNKGVAPEKVDPNVTPALNPFVEVDVSKAWLRRVQVLECASESDSDGEPATLDNVCHGDHEDSSDAESIDSLMEDPLRYSGAFTAEEAVLLARNKMMKLQVLYQKQYDKILMTLKEKRRHYLSALKKERETLCSVYDQSNNSAKDKKMYEKLKALHRYHRKSNRETIAYICSQEKRARQNGVVKPVASKCTYTEGGVRCCGPTLPLTKFCFKHILQDTNQCIFRACGCVKADSLCQEPVVELTGDETCLLHYKLPSLPHLPSTSNDGYDSPGKVLEAESELDASATESAISTDNGVTNEDLSMDTTRQEVVQNDTQSTSLCSQQSLPDNSIDTKLSDQLKQEIHIKKETGVKMENTLTDDKDGVLKTHLLPEPQNVGISPYDKACIKQESSTYIKSDDQSMEVVEETVIEDDEHYLVIT